MIPMKVYFTTKMLTEFITWYESNPKLPEIEGLSIDTVSDLITITDGHSPDKPYDIMPQVVITSTPEIIQLVDKFLFEKQIVGTKDKRELRINLR